MKPCDWDQESFCCEDGCDKPATHERLEGMAGDIPMYELVCCEHANKIEPAEIYTMAYETLIKSGLLWYINHELLHPKGLALGINIHDDGKQEIDVWVAKDLVWEFPPDVNKEKSEIFANWYEEKTKPYREAE